MKIVYVLIFKILLDLFYPISVKNFSYLWGISFNFELKRVLFGYILLIVFSMFIYSKKNKEISSIILEILFTLIAIPIVTVYTYNNEKLLYMLIVLFTFILIKGLIVLEKKILKNVISLKKYLFLVSKKKMMTVFFMASIIIIIVSLYKNNINISAFNITKIYAIRANLKLNTFLKYAIPFQIFFISPYIFLNSLESKKIINIIVILIIQLIIYMIYAQKIFLIVLFLPYLFYKTKDLSKGILKINCAIILITLVIKKQILESLVDRAYLVPAILNYKYYNYFQKNDFNYFSGSKLGLLFPKFNNGIALAPKMAAVLFDNKANPNTGFIASAYGEMGIGGVFLIVILVSLTFFIIDSLVVYNKKNLLSILIFPFLTLVNGQFVSIFLTQGLIFILSYYLIVREKK